MMHEGNIGQGMQKQFIKAIDLYHRPLHNDGKNKNNHQTVSRLYQGVSIAQGDKKNNHHSQINKVISFLTKIQLNISKQYEKVSLEMNELRKRIISYYFQFRKIIEKHETQLILQIQHNQKQNKQILQQHLQKVRKKRTQFQKQNFKKSFQQHKSDLKQLAIVEVPVYRIQANSFQSLKKILQQVLEQFKPTFVGKINKSNQSKKLKQNQPPHYPLTQSITNSQIIHKKSSQKKQENESTIKKQSNPSISPAYIQQFNPICQFSCDQKLEWNSNETKDLNSHFGMHYNGNGNRFDKKQIVSEIIVQQPSSCEDSLMISDVP